MQHSFSIAELEQTRQLAARFSSLCEAPITLALDGDLGAGKTQFIRYFAESLGVHPEEVTSPTYVLLQRYTGDASLIYHFDFYRLENEAQVWDLGIDELYEQPVIILIEWASKFPQCLPEDFLQLNFTNSAADHRSLTATAEGPTSSQLLTKLGQ